MKDGQTDGCGSAAPRVEERCEGEPCATRVPGGPSHKALMGARWQHREDADLTTAHGLHPQANLSLKKNAEITFTQLRYSFLHKTNTINSSPGLHGGSGSTSLCFSSIIHQGMKARLEDCCLSKHRSSVRYGTLLARRSPSVVAQHPAKQQRGSEEIQGRSEQQQAGKYHWYRKTQIQKQEI